MPATAFCLISAYELPGGSLFQLPLDFELELPEAMSLIPVYLYPLDSAIE